MKKINFEKKLGKNNDQYTPFPMVATNHRGRDKMQI
jgi:hypothetical protein